MMRRRITAQEEDRCDALGRAWRRARDGGMREHLTGAIVEEADRLNLDGVTHADMSAHFGFTPEQLRRLRRSKRQHLSKTSAARPQTLPLFSLRLDLDDRGLRPSDMPQPTIASWNTSESRAALQRLDNMQHVAATANGVFVALGVDPDVPDARRLGLRKEAKEIERALPESRPPRLSLDVTTVDLQGMAIQQPFVLHLAAHREYGSTMLTDPEGNRVPVLDQDLAKLLRPAAGGPSVLVLSLCDSHEIARLLQDEDMAVISFIGTVVDGAAIAFARHIYDAIGRGRTISMAFEAAAAAVRGASGLQPTINVYSTAHNRTLPS